MHRRQPAARQRGVRLTNHTEGISCPAVSPRVTEWLPRLLSTLTAHTEETVRRHSSLEDPWRTSSQLLTRLHPTWRDLDTPWTDDLAEAVAYIRAITTKALTDDSPHTDPSETVTAIGTGRGPVNASLGALAKGPVTLHRELDTHPTVCTLLLDGEAWTELTDRRTGVRALAAIAVLADGFDVRLIASPTLRRHLAKRYPKWCDCHLDLTESRDRSPHTPHSHTSHAAWEAIHDLDTEPGKRRLLAKLTQPRSYDDIAGDDAIDIAAGTVSRYVLDLEARGLVTVDRRGHQHTVYRTELGDTAVTQCLDDNHELVHPDQRRLDGRLTTTPHGTASAVSPPGMGAPPSMDEWVQTTGDPETDSEYVQWLTPPNTHDDPLHRRFATVAHDDAVTLVDDQPAPFEDGRVAYLSHTPDETLVVLQWGGPLATLGRLAGALLSEKALTHILTPERLGEEFEALSTNHTKAIARVLRRGRQVGWYSDDETTYGAWRERITTVRDRLLASLANLTTSDNTAARSELFEELHGLVASATQLYHAAGIDLTTTIRIPDTTTLTRNHSRLENLCEFLGKTVPKQSVYGIHSGYRLLFEDRPEKLRRRLSYDVEPDTHLDLTMSWVIAGPTATTLHDDIAASLSEALAGVRPAIANGTEAAPTLKIPVVDATTYPAIRRVIDDVALTDDIQWSPHQKRQLIRLCLQAFGPVDTARSCPYDVVESLLRAHTESPCPTPADLEQAAATLPPTRFRPDLTPTATKLYGTLLRADRPLGRSELIEKAGISASSYDRRLDDVAALEGVHAVQVDGHRRWSTERTTPAGVAATPDSLVRLPPHCVVSSHATPETRRRAGHPALQPPIQPTMRDTTLPVTRHEHSHSTQDDASLSNTALTHPRETPPHQPTALPSTPHQNHGGRQ